MAEARKDIPTDLAIGLLLTVGGACWVGLVAGQLGCFGRGPVVAAAVVAAGAAAAGLRGAAKGAAASR